MVKNIQFFDYDVQLSSELLVVISNLLSEDGNIVTIACRCREVIPCIVSALKSLSSIQTRRDVAKALCHLSRLIYNFIRDL